MCGGGPYCPARVSAHQSSGGARGLAPKEHYSGHPLAPGLKVHVYNCLCKTETGVQV